MVASVRLLRGYERLPSDVHDLAAHELHESREVLPSRAPSERDTNGAVHDAAEVLTVLPARVAGGKVRADLRAGERIAHLARAGIAEGTALKDQTSTKQAERSDTC